jgi:hypothetical protein
MVIQSSSSTFARTARGKLPARSRCRASMIFRRPTRALRTLFVLRFTTKLIRFLSPFRLSCRVTFWPGVFAAHEVDNFRLAETEKYAHVTYFFNGGTEREFPARKTSAGAFTEKSRHTISRRRCPAFKITDKFLRAIESARLMSLL